jgi:hypothetical protein
VYMLIDSFLDRSGICKRFTIFLIRTNVHDSLCCTISINEECDVFSG